MFFFIDNYKRLCFNVEKMLQRMYLMTQETTPIRVTRDDKDFIDKVSRETGKKKYFILHEALKLYKKNYEKSKKKGEK